MNILPSTKLAGAGLSAAAFLLVGCTGDGVPKEQHDQTLKEKSRLQMEVEDLEAQLKKAAEASTPAPAADTSELEKKIDELLQENEAKESALDALKKEMRDYKAKYRLTVREKIIGKKVAKLVTQKDVFEDVEVKEITAVGLRILHSGGSGRVRFEDLSKAMQDQLGYDEEEAAEILERELAEKEAKAAQLAAAKEAQAPTKKKSVNRARMPSKPKRKKSTCG